MRLPPAFVIEAPLPKKEDKTPHKIRQVPLVYLEQRLALDRLLS